MDDVSCFCCTAFVEDSTSNCRLVAFNISSTLRRCVGRAWHVLFDSVLPAVWTNCSPRPSWKIALYFDSIADYSYCIHYHRGKGLPNDFSIIDTLFYKSYRLLRQQWLNSLQNGGKEDTWVKGDFFPEAPDCLYGRSVKARCKIPQLYVKVVSRCTLFSCFTIDNVTSIVYFLESCIIYLYI